MPQLVAGYAFILLLERLGLAWSIALPEHLARGKALTRVAPEDLHVPAYGCRVGKPDRMTRLTSFTGRTAPVTYALAAPALLVSQYLAAMLAYAPHVSGYFDTGETRFLLTLLPSGSTQLGITSVQLVACSR